MLFTNKSSDKPKPSRCAPDRDSTSTLESLRVELHTDTAKYVEDSEALANAIALNDVFANPLVVAAAFSACMGGLLFGFDQGILSIVLTMPQFLSQFPDVDKDASFSAAFNKGIMTALLELGALIGAFQAGFFIIGSIIQTTSFSFAQLVVGRFIGGLGVGLLSAVAPVYISEGESLTQLISRAVGRHVHF
ncbi:hypothetical protein L198_00789 [Cryptococcus wingfieldii CBS 7118]|uniref:Major facilitator superfamily (MFS) profile domain-containing protein n=1 Tax=Cryptococcus wingfieldii CBS 7118 TaxID=1295528 RepID=A0A1E3K248_9TREE|nr:hypothetical protein L198_00789 [Cryptococcus wingfieldii CBS 7118]ODO07210.1 hypothetical protein L198_00789 [Cryptococcus wingfieldii CBS 7118]